MEHDQWVEIVPGHLWRHYLGGVYRVVCLAVRESDKRDQIVYQNVNGGKCWVRDLASWLQVVTVLQSESESDKRPRFVRVEPAEFADTNPAGRDAKDRGPEY